MFTLAEAELGATEESAGITVEEMEQYMKSLAVAVALHI
jgi:hypothetical protein